MPKGQYDRSKARFRPWQELFLAKFEMGRRSECWPWLAYVMPNGYGRLGKKCAHVVSYEFFWGPIPEGYDVDHVRARGCIRRDCVNPWHLEAVTRRENLLRGDTITARNAAKTHCVHGHTLSDAKIRKNGTRYCATCSRLESAASWQARKQRNADARERAGAA